MANPSPRLENLRPFKPGETGNPGGKAKNARNKLQTKFLYDLAEDFDLHGKQAIKDARESDPMGYIKAIAALMPKQVEETKPMDDLTDAELVAGIAILRARISDSSGAGAEATFQPESFN